MEKDNIDDSPQDLNAINNNKSKINKNEKKIKHKTNQNNDKAKIKETNEENKESNEENIDTIMKKLEGNGCVLNEEQNEENKESKEENIDTIKEKLEDNNNILKDEQNEKNKESNKENIDTIQKKLEDNNNILNEEQKIKEEDIKAEKIEVTEEKTPEKIIENKEENNITKEEDKKLVIKENEQEINEKEITNEIKEDSEKTGEKIDEKTDEEKNETIIKHIDYNNIYFIIKRINEKNLAFKLSKEDPEIIINNIKTIKIQNNNVEEIIEIINIKIESEKNSEEKLQILIINNETNNKDKNEELIISTNKDIKEFYNYIPFYNYNGQELLKTPLVEQFKIYIEFLKEIPNESNKFEKFIKSTIYYLKDNKYTFEFYISIFIEFHHQFYVEEILEIFDKNNIITNEQDIKEDIKDNIINLSNNPNDICIKDESRKAKLIEIFYEIILYYYIHFQFDKIECLLENKNYIYYENFIQYIPNCAKNKKQFSKEIILNLLSVSKSIIEVHNILLLVEKKIKNIHDILDIITEQQQKIYELNKKEKKKINLFEYAEINENDDMNLLLEKLEKLNKNKGLEFIQISNDIIKKYIDFNKAKLDNLYVLKNIINILPKNENLSTDINKNIHDLILQSDEKIRHDYFIKDENLRTLEMIKTFELSKLIDINEELNTKNNTNLEKIFLSNQSELYKIIMPKINNIKDIEKIYSLIDMKKQEIIDFLGEIFKNKINGIKDGDNIINDISNLISFCIEKNCKLEEKLIEVLKNHKNKSIFKKVISCLIKVKKDELILKCLKYLDKDLNLILEIINSEKDIMLDYFKKGKQKIDLSDAYFSDNNKNKLLDNLNSLKNNTLISYIIFHPTNFELIKNDEKILSFIIENIKREKDKEEWNNLIRENINILITNGKLKDSELLQLINLKKDIEIKKEYLSIDVFDGISIEALKDENCYKEFKESKLIEIFISDNEIFIKKIISLLNKIKMEEEFHDNIKKLLEEIISHYNKRKDYKSISKFILLASQEIKNEFVIKFVIKKTNSKFKNDFLKIYLKLEEKQGFPQKWRELFIKYLLDGDNIEKIVEVIKKCKNKKEIFSKIKNDLILKVENLESLIKIIEEKNNNYKLLDALKKYFKKEYEDVEYVKKSNEILNELKMQLNQINFCNYINSEKYIKNKKMLNFLYVDEKEKKEAKDNIEKKIQKYKSYKFFLNYIFFPLLIFIIIIPFLYSKIDFGFNNDNNSNLVEINWDIFNKSKELAQNESSKYPFEQILNIDFKENKDENIIKNNQQNDLNDTIIIGIDLGSINTGYSYTIKSINNDNEKIKINDEKKYPNEIEISRNEQKGLKYALKASVSLANYGLEELNNINFIKGIKNLMYLDKYNNDNLCYFYPNEFVNEINITNVFKEYLLMIKNDILKKFKEEKININKIKWILSVPQCWNEFEKQIIINSAIESGLSDISLIYESESAALSLYLDNSLPNDFIKRKKNIILIDIGGINTQLSIYELNKDYITEKIQIKNNIIKNTGFLNIVEKIINVLEETLGKKNIIKIKKEDPGSWIRIVKDIQKAIENTYKRDGIEIFDIYIPFSFQGKYEYKYESEKGIKKYIIKYDSYNLIFPAGLIGNFIYESINNILNNVTNIINEMKSNRIVINNIVVTGGFSKNRIFQNEIKNFFIENPHMHIYFLSSYDNAITKGEVYYGLNNTIIKNRFSTKTIGIKIDNKIQILLKKGENMKSNFNKTIFIKPTKGNKNLIQINVYTSNTNEILSENDFVGRLIIPLNNKNNDVIMVKIKYDVALTFKAYNKNNGEEIKTKFEYFK